MIFRNLCIKLVYNISKDKKTYWKMVLTDKLINNISFFISEVLIIDNNSA